MKKLNRNCPCSGTCCENPRPSGSDHDCTEQCEDICEENFETICSNCGESCYCEL